MPRCCMFFKLHFLRKWTAFFVYHLADDDLWTPIITLKVESLPDCSKKPLSFSDKSNKSNAPNIGVHTGLIDAATLRQQRADRDESNLRQWSPDGLFPKFSTYVQPLLHGAPMSAQKQRALSCQLRDEIIRFLNKHKLIQNNNGSTKRWKYCALGRSLDARYPDMVWDQARPGTKMHCREKNSWSVFIQRLSSTRKTQNLRQLRKQKKSQLATNSKDL